jgi:multiple sugar transport system ATP-binding protein
VAQVRLVEIAKEFPGTEAAAVAGIDLTIEDGEFFVLLGPSGCGKTTLLRLIAGLEEPTTGELYIGERLANYTDPMRRNVAMVFQNYALYPHMSAEANIRFPLKMRRLPKEETASAIRDAARMLGLDATLLGRPVSQLSGGQRQRVALARAIVRKPAVMLMDEPLSNLDAMLRHQTREELLGLHRAMGTTVVYVTHDQVEAMTMGDRIAVMNEGRIVQVGTPAQVYDEPVDRFVGGFVGSPPMNFLAGRIERSDGRAVFVGPAVRIELPGQIAERIESARSDDHVLLGARPEAITIRPVALATEGGWRVEAVEQLGAERIVIVRSHRDLIRVRADRDLALSPGEDVTISIKPDDAHVFSPADGAARNVRCLKTAGAQLQETPDKLASRGELLTE